MKELLRSSQIGLELSRKIEIFFAGLLRGLLQSNAGSASTGKLPGDDSLPAPALLPVMLCWA